MPSELRWRKSSHSGSSEIAGTCVEVAASRKERQIRDSKNPDGPRLKVEPAAFRALIAGIKAG